MSKNFMILGSEVWETEFVPHGPRRSISPESKFQFSQTGGPNFLQNHKLNQIKPSNLKKLLEVVRVCMEPRNYRFHLGPKILSSQKSRVLAPIFTNMTHLI